MQNYGTSNSSCWLLVRMTHDHFMPSKDHWVLIHYMQSSVGHQGILSYPIVSYATLRYPTLSYHISYHNKYYDIIKYNTLKIKVTGCPKCAPSQKVPDMWTITKMLVISKPGKPKGEGICWKELGEHWREDRGQEAFPKELAPIVLEPKISPKEIYLITSGCRILVFVFDCFENPNATGISWGGGGSQLSFCTEMVQALP